jgi:hypothetical protein
MARNKRNNGAGKKEPAASATVNDENLSASETPYSPLSLRNREDVEAHINVLLSMYNEQCTQARHYETQRATITGFLMLISGAIIGLITFDQHITRADIFPALFLIALSSFGALSSHKHFVRAQRHGYCAENFRKALNGILPDSQITELREKGKNKIEEEFPKSHKLRLHHIWSALHLMIGLLGALLALLAVFGNKI